MTDLLADAPFIGMRETPYTGAALVSYMETQIRRYWYDDWAKCAKVQAPSDGYGQWSVSVEWPGVEWFTFPQADGSALLCRFVPDLSNPGEFVEEKRIIPAPIVPDARLRPKRGRKVALPPLDDDELSTLLGALSVYASETGRYDHNAAYLERVLRRAIKASQGTDDGA